MSDGSLHPVPHDSSAELRRRNVPSAPKTDDDTTSSGPEPEGASWQAQLAEARRAMAARMEQQAQELDADPSQPAGPAGEASEDPSGTMRGEGESRRRASVASSEGDNEVVEELLRPRSAQTAAPVRGREEAISEEAVPDEGAGPTNEGGGETATPQRPPEDEKMCRICFGGEDEEEMGKLFSPCLCRGTSRHVHTKCLESWRKAAASPRAFHECPQCRYQYRFRRTAFARVVTSGLTVTFLTSLAFMALVFLSGFLANSLIAAVEARQSLAPSFFNDYFVADHILVGEGIREAVSFVEHQLEESRWVSGRDLALQRAAQDDSTTYRFLNPSLSRKRKAVPPKPPIFVTALMHFTKGSALLGIMSTFYTYAAATFVSPLGRTLFRALRPAGGRRRAADRAASMSQLVIILLIVIGVVKSVRQVYRGVKWLTKIALSRVEDLVIEVNA